MKTDKTQISTVNLNFYKELYLDPSVAMSYEVRNSERILKSSSFLTKQLRGKRVLDVGFGTGNTLFNLLDTEACVYGIDLVNNNIIRLKTMSDIKNGNLYLCTASAMNMPFKANSFDLVICAHVIEHLEDDTEALREIERVLIPGGIGLVVLPLHDDAKCHKKKYVYGELDLLGKGTSLELIEIKGYSFIKFPFKILTFLDDRFLKKSIRNRKFRVANGPKLSVSKVRKLYHIYIVPLLLYLSRIGDYIVRLFNNPGQAMIVFHKKNK